MTTYYVIWAYGTTSASTTQTVATFATFEHGDYSQEDDHIKFKPGIYRYESTQNLTLLGGNYNVTTFDKGSWPPPPGHAVQTWGSSQDLRAEITAGTDQTPGARYAALFVYNEAAFEIDGVDDIHIDTFFDGHVTVDGNKRTFRRGVYRMLSRIGDQALGEVLVSRADGRQHGERHACAPHSFDAVAFDTNMVSKLPPNVLHEFGSARQIYTTLLADLIAEDDRRTNSLSKNKPERDSRSTT